MKGKYAHLFETTHLHADIRRRTVRGGIATLVAQAFNVIQSVASIAILAHLLTPADYGLVAMVMALTGFLALFKDAGLSMATVQQEQITHEQVSTLFWINVAVSCVLTLCAFASAPILARFYDEPKLLPIAITVGGLFIIDGLTIQHQALLRRQMLFGALARIGVLSTFLGLIAAIASAVAGAGYWALIVQVAVSQIAGTALTWEHCPWIPGRPRRGVGARSMLGFGGYLTAFSFLNYFARNLDNILIGKVWGSLELGLYSRAYGLLLLPLQQVNGPLSAVAIPALSRLQHNPIRFREFFRQALAISSFIAFPMVAWLIICRREIIMLCLGNGWEKTIPIFALLAISGFFQPIGNIVGWLYIALGRAKRMFTWGLIGCTWIMLSYLVGLPYGASGVALSYSVAVAIMIIPLIQYAISGTPIALIDVLFGIRLPAFATSIAAETGLIAQQYLTAGSPPIYVLAIISAYMVSSYLIIYSLISPQMFSRVLTFFSREGF